MTDRELPHTDPDPFHIPSPTATPHPTPEEEKRAQELQEKYQREAIRRQSKL
jgi:hypothetical protein